MGKKTESSPNNQILLQSTFEVKNKKQNGMWKENRVWIELKDQTCFHHIEDAKMVCTSRKVIYLIC